MRPKRPSSTAATLRRLAEARLAESPGKETSEARGGRAEADAGRTLHELQVHQIELEMQNTELHETRDRLEAQLEKYTDLYDFAPVGYFSLDEKGVIQEVNLTGAALLGVDRSRLIHQRISRFVAVASRPVFLAFLERVFAGSGDQDCDLALVRVDDASFWARLRGTVAVSAGDPRRWCRVSMADITARMQVQAEERLRGEILAQVTDAVVLIDNDERITYLNPALERLYRVQPGEMLGRKVGELCQRRWLEPGDEAAAHATLREHGEAIWELIHITRDGRELHVQSSVCLMRDAAGHVTGIIASLRDITAQKRAEAALRLGNERFDLAVKCSQVVLFQQDLELRYTWLQNAVPGFDDASVIGKRDSEVMERAADAAVTEALKWQVLRSGVSQRQEISVQVKGAVRHYDLLVEPLREVGDSISGVTCAAIDITQLRDAEAARYEMERNYRALAVASSEVAYCMSADWSTMMPLDGRQLVPNADQPVANWTWLDQNIPRDEHPRVRQAIGEAIAGKRLFELEHRVRRPDGSTGWTLSRAMPILDENEHVTAWFGAASDITARKQAEVELQRVSVLLDTLLHTAPIGFCFLDRDLRFGRINERLAAMNGLPAEAHIGRQVSEILPSLTEAVREVTARILATGEAVLNHEFSSETPAAPGETRCWNESWYPVRDDAGAIMGFGGIVEEITARKQAETALRASEERRSLALTAAQMVAWELDPATATLVLSANAADVFGLPPAAPLTISGEGFALVHPPTWTASGRPSRRPSRSAAVT